MVFGYFFYSAPATPPSTSADGIACISKEVALAAEERQNASMSPTAANRASSISQKLIEELLHHGPLRQVPTEERCTSIYQREKSSDSAKLITHAMSSLKHIEKRVPTDSAATECCALVQPSAEAVVVQKTAKTFKNTGRGKAIAITQDLIAELKNSRPLLKHVDTSSLPKCLGGAQNTSTSSLVPVEIKCLRQHISKLSEKGGDRYVSTHQINVTLQNNESYRLHLRMIKAEAARRHATSNRRKQASAQQHNLRPKLVARPLSCIIEAASRAASEKDLRNIKSEILAELQMWAINNLSTDDIIDGTAGVNTKVTQREAISPSAACTCPNSAVTATAEKLTDYIVVDEPDLPLAIAASGMGVRYGILRYLFSWW